MDFASEINFNASSRPTTLSGKLADWMVGGLKFDQSEEGGVECMNHATHWNRFTITVISFVINAALIYHGSKRMNRPVVLTDRAKMEYFSIPKILLLCTLSTVLGMQLAFKAMRRAMVFLLSPCHVITFLWVLVLCMQPSSAHGNFREVLIHLFHGQVLPLIFPTTQWLKLPFEFEMFWIQHLLIFVLPPLVIYLDRNVYPAYGNKWVDWNFVNVAYGWWMMLHCLNVIISVMTLANVAHMLCPAYTDPVGSPYHIHAGLVHQYFAIAFYSLILRAFARFVAKFSDSEIIGEGAPNGHVVKDRVD